MKWEEEKKKEELRNVNSLVQGSRDDFRLATNASEKKIDQPASLN
jgi:hypothetical protein